MSGDGGSRLHRVSIIALAVVPPAVLTLLCTSSITSLGESTYRLLVHNYLSRSIEYELHHLSLFIGAILAFFGYLFDVHLWTEQYRRLSATYFWIAALFLAIGVLFYTTLHPAIPLVLGVMASLAGVAYVRYVLFVSEPPCVFSRDVSVVFAGLAFAFVAVWILWLAKTDLDADHVADEEVAMRMSVKCRFMAPGLRKVTGMLMWSSPVVLASFYFVVSIMAAMRSHIHALTDNGSHEEQFVDAELRVALLVLACVSGSLWVAALLLVNDAELANTVILISFVVFASIFVYIFLVIGKESILRVAETNTTVNSMMGCLESDWARAAKLLFLWPVLPIYFAVEVLHRFVRSRMVEAGFLPLHAGQPDQFGYLTEEAAIHYHSIFHEWNKSSVLLKSMYLGLLLFVVKVVFGSGTTLFLSWVNERLASWPLWEICLSLFFMGVTMFCLPPVPGLPIYYISGILISQRCLKDGLGLWAGVLLAAALCLVLKLAAVTIEQKGIGESFSDSIAVKKIVQVYTPPIKAVRHILKQPGLGLAKVAVLVGGPDWPTSVLTGILRLPLLPMLVGTLPVVVLIVPIVMATAFQVLAGQEGQSAKYQYKSLATIMLMLSTIIQMGFLLSAAFYMQAVAQEHKDDIEAGGWEEDPQEKEVLVSVEEDERWEARTRVAARWARAPSALQVIVVFGSLAASATVYILLVPDFVPFKEFTLTDSISDLPGGNPLSLVNQSGWVAIGLSCFVLLDAAAFQAWCAHRTRITDEQSLSYDDESAPLLGFSKEPTHSACCRA